ncbi:MAG: 30S ribosomal protein S24e [Methanosarcinales archaeon]
MEIEIIEEKTNPLLNRQEITFKIEHKDATPSRNYVKKKLVALLNSKPELVIIEKLSSQFGKKETLGYAKIYESRKRAEQIEREYILKRNTLSEKPEEELAESIKEETEESIESSV